MLEEKTVCVTAVDCATCSFTYKQISLNNNILPGPTLSPPLLDLTVHHSPPLLHRTMPLCAIVETRFSRSYCYLKTCHSSAFSEETWKEIRPQISMNGECYNLFHFNPACTTNALQRHVRDNSEGNEDVVESIQQSFHVGQLQSQHQAKNIIDKMRPLLVTGGFDSGLASFLWRAG